MTVKSRITVAEINHIKRQRIMKVMLYTPTEVAAVLGCSERKIFDLVRDGKLLAASENPGRRGIRISAVSVEN
jgi:excisionase family DNA binding protein